MDLLLGCGPQPTPNRILAHVGHCGGQRDHAEHCRRCLGDLFALMMPRYNEFCFWSPLLGCDAARISVSGRGLDGETRGATCSPMPERAGLPPRAVEGV